MPAGVSSLELESKRALMQLRRKSSPLEKYIFLQGLQDTNESIYYHLLIENTAELMPIVYTPTVGQACLEFSHIYRQTPRGLYISLNDIGSVAEILDAWPEKNIRAIVFTDGVCICMHLRQCCADSSSMLTISCVCVIMCHCCSRSVSWVSVTWV